VSLRFRDYARHYRRFVVSDFALTAVERRAAAEWRRLALLMVVAAALVAAALVLQTRRRYPADRKAAFASDVEHFKYGSIGSDNTLRGLPYDAFVVLPEVFRHLLPPGAPADYTAFGFIQERVPAGGGTAPPELPIGFSRRTHRLDFAGINCALCHTGVVRGAPGAPALVVPGMPANTVDLWRFFKFLMDAAADERFTAETLLPHMEARRALDGFEKTLYKTQIIPQFRAALLAQRQRVGRIFRDNPPWGPGRVDTFGPYKTIQFGIPLDALPARESIGTADLPSLWNQGAREGMRLHWDGNNDSVRERNFSASFGAGTTPSTVDLEGLFRVEDWVRELPPPPYPFAVDAAQAAAGKRHYLALCHGCHGGRDFRQEFVSRGFPARGPLRLGMVEPLEDLPPQHRTDRHRLDSFTYQLSAHQGLLMAGTPHQLRRFRKTGGYANMPLDGLWARAPYLHNGSVPSVWDLLQPAARRPARFYRGHTVYDKHRLGFRSTAEDLGAEAPRAFLFDTSRPGNANIGHEYGAHELDETQKWELVEFLKTM
jgi:hypothetical protein